MPVNGLAGAGGQGNLLVHGAGCADYLDKSSNGREFDGCRSELESFKEELASFIECRQQELRNEQEELRSKVDDLLTDYRQAVERYNCKARGEDFCY